MAASPGFIFSADKGSGFLTPEQIANRRRVLEAMQARSAGDMPRNLGEGIAAIGQALSRRFEANYLDKQEGALRQRQAGIDADLSSALSYDPSGSSAATDGRYTAADIGAAAPALSTKPGDENIYSDFIGTVKGGVTNPYGLAAVAATGKAESGYSAGNAYRQWSDPSESGRPGQAGGIMSWRADRLSNLRRFAADNGDDPSRPSAKTQAAFFLNEDPGLIERLNGAKSVEEAQGLMNNAWAFAGHDRPGGEAARRLDAARSYLPTFMGGPQASAAPVPSQEPVQVASLDPSIGLDSALSYSPRGAPSVRQSIGNAIAAQGGASIDGQISPEDQARYNQLVGREPGQVDPNAVPYTGPAEYNTPEMRLDTNGARVTRDSEERAPTVRQALGSAMAAQGGQASASTQLAALPAPQTVTPNAAPSPEAAFSPAVQQQAASDPGFDGFAQTGAQKVANAMMARGIGLPAVPAAPDGSELPAFASPDMTPVQRVQHAVSVAQARSGQDPSALYRVLASPYARPDQKEAVKIILTRMYDRQDLAEKRDYEANNPDAVLDRRYKQAQINALGAKQPNTTDDIREFQFAKDQGYTGSFADWQLAQKKAGAGSTTVTVGENGSEFVKKSDEAAAKRLGEIVEAGNAAPQFMADIQTLADLGKSVGTGKGAQLLAAFGPYAEAVGFDIKGLDEAQAYQGIIARLAPNMRPAGSGATSDFDARQFLQSLPSLGNSEEGNALISDTFRALSDNRTQAAEIAQRAQSGEMKWQDAERAIRALPSPYEAFRTYRDERRKLAPTGDAPSPAPTAAPAPNGSGSNWPQGGQVARPRSAAELNALPSGTMFVAPDGTTRRKP